MAFGCLGYIIILFISSRTFSFNYYSFQVIKGRKIMCVAKELLRASKSWVCLQIQLTTTKQQIRITKKECREKIINPPFFHHISTVFKGLGCGFCTSLCNRTQEFEADETIVIQLFNFFLCFAGCTSGRGWERQASPWWQSVGLTTMRNFCDWCSQWITLDKSQLFI